MQGCVFTKYCISYDDPVVRNKCDAENKEEKDLNLASMGLMTHVNM